MGNFFGGGLSPGGIRTTAYAPNASDVVIKGGPGRLCRAIVTTVGTVNTVIYDNATAGSGTVIGIIKSTAAVGDIIEFLMPAANGITVKGSANNATVTISYD